MRKDKEENQRLQPPQQQDRQSGGEPEMRPRPKAEDHTYKGCAKLNDKVALITCP